MNKQKLIRKYEDACFAVVPVDEVLEDLQQLDEPQKPVVSQMVADWYEENKDHLDYNLWDIIVDMGDKEIEQPEIAKWINVTPNAITTIVNMHQFGYEVEKEKRYLVNMKGLREYDSYLNYDSIDNEWYFTDVENGPVVGTYHTRKQLEDAGFGEVFDSPLFEVEEVE